jgi:hypothetical protein
VPHVAQIPRRKCGIVDALGGRGAAVAGAMGHAGILAS